MGTKESWHGGHHYSNKIHLAFILFLFLTAITLFWTFYNLHSDKIYSGISPSPTLNPTISKPPSNEVFCTQEAKQCPDGSYVGRSGPKCEFAKCPDKVTVCGGIAGLKCPTGYNCELEGNYPDASGVCKMNP